MRLAGFSDGRYIVRSVFRYRNGWDVQRDNKRNGYGIQAGFNCPDVLWAYWEHDVCFIFYGEEKSGAGTASGGENYNWVKGAKGVVLSGWTKNRVCAVLEIRKEAFRDRE